MSFAHPADSLLEMSQRRVSCTRTQVLIGGVFALGLGALASALALDSVQQPWALALIVALSALGESIAVRLHHEGRVSTSVVGVVVAAIALGPLEAVVVAGFIASTGWLVFARKDIAKFLFNFGHQSVAAVAAGWLAAATLGLLPQSAHGIDLVLAGVVAGMAAFLVSSVAVTAIIAASTRGAPVAVYAANFPWLIPHYAAFGAVAGGVAVAYHGAGISAALVVALPMVLSRYSIKQVLDKTRENVLRLEKSNQQIQGAYAEIRKMSDDLDSAYAGTLESLVTALDVRDQETRGHSQRVARHSSDVATLLGFKDPLEMATIYRGALMHDVGKIGIRDNVLLKPGPLTEDEWVFMKKHAAMGYDILAQVPYLRPAAAIVLAHHERWDGGGYPKGLKADEIPFGARIFALCDTYDAIISDRPYRAGRSPDAALQEILRCAGSQFDPKVVEAFEALYPAWSVEDGKDTRPPLYLPSWREATDKARAAG